MRLGHPQAQKMKRKKSAADKAAAFELRGANFCWQMSHEAEFKWDKRNVQRSGCAAANDRELLGKLAEFANIPGGQLEQFQVGVGLQIADLWRSHNEKHLYQPEQKSKGLTLRLRQVTAHCLKAKEALQRLDGPGVRDVMRSAVGVEMLHQKIDDLPRRADRERDFVPLLKSLDLLVEVCADALDVAKIKTPPRRRGRPDG